MKLRHLALSALLLGLAACGQPAGTGADQQASVTAVSGELTEQDRATLLTALGLSADASGQILNECGERSTPQFLPAELGGAAGSATLVAIPGGPNTVTCYGDGSDLHLFVRADGGWREVYSARGRMLIVLTTTTDGVRDIADGGPGFSFPVWTWNGRVYAQADRSIADSELGGATYLP